MLDGVTKFLQEHNLSSLDQLRGTALKNILPVENIERDPPIVAVQDMDKCTNCARCLKICFFGAISQHNKDIRIDSRACDGCGLCVQVCPDEAVIMKRITK
jgi:dihydropyrimidine dehydrogenase (NAD+) subunit PreA